MLEYAGHGFNLTLTTEPPDFMEFLNQSRMTYAMSSVAGIVVGRGNFYRMFPDFPGLTRPTEMPTFWLVRVPYIHIVWITAALPGLWIWGRFARSREDHG